MIIGTTPVHHSSKQVRGEFITHEDERYYKISHYDAMPPFFMSIVSSTDHWLFISSNGALTAGRRNPDMALFPYYTDDQIQDAAEVTGSKTILQVTKGDDTYSWEPFSDRYGGMYAVTRNLYKTVFGDKLVFEEVNHDLNLTFRYAWMSSDLYGLVRKAWLVNNGTEPTRVRLLDGVRNLLPYGVTQVMQNRVSTLVDAYKKNELDPDTGLGMYLLSSIIVDRAEPSEALKCHTVWSIGLPNAAHLLCERQLSAFRRGLPVRQETDIRAERGAYLLVAGLELGPAAEESWYLVAEVNQGPSEVAALRQRLAEPATLRAELDADLLRGSQKLGALVGGADGLQWTTDQPMANRHFANVLFNIMRGGVFFRDYQLPRRDFAAFVHDFNRTVANAHAASLAALPRELSYGELLDWATGTGDQQLLRLCYEYLPLTFSRRHGDPSRPWNRFSIEVKAEDGSERLYYAGNWRDIFQNWEALAFAFPHFTEGMISKFVNASTPDGYNPYRITRDGIDWEVIEPDDPWSYIGYWGDHQIIYLQKLLEASRCHHPGKLATFLAEPLFSYANVPYRIKCYEDLLVNPADTVIFDEELDAQIEKRVAEVGADGKLLADATGKVYQVNLTEKLLVSILAKLSNYIPEGGIWLNTQRPEWNDANNALVGNGVSMVTLYYLRRMLAFLDQLYADSEVGGYSVSEAVAELFTDLKKALEDGQYLLDGPTSDQDRKRLMDQLGGAGSRYREKVYQQGFSGKPQSISKGALRDFFATALRHIDHSIRANRRADGLYHAYNLMTVDGPEAVSLQYLYEMLEGQVAVLSSGLLEADEALSVLRALRRSSMYRADQHSYLLYPDRELPRFLEKNNIPVELAEASPLIQRLVADGNRLLVERDVQGNYHFNGDIRNAEDVKARLEALRSRDNLELVAAETDQLLELFEAMFDHKSFTGRSGTFFGYEGLGSIYWHMVSKLLLAAQENCWWAISAGADDKTVQALIEAYYDIRAGIGFNKTPDNYGAFPLDPYSHTPAHAGAQQPGMTGQVKEDILARFGELGVIVEGGRIHFRPALLRASEFSTAAVTFAYFDQDGQSQALELPAGALAFTYCQVPVVYHRADQSRVQVTYRNGTTHEQDEPALSAADSRHLFDRSREITRVAVWLRPGQ